MGLSTNQNIYRIIVDEEQCTKKENKSTCLNDMKFKSIYFKVKLNSHKFRQARHVIRMGRGLGENSIQGQGLMCKLCGQSQGSRSRKSGSGQYKTRYQSISGIRENINRKGHRQERNDFHSFKSLVWRVSQLV